jgi:hypothetical protein
VLIQLSGTIGLSGGPTKERLKPEAEWRQAHTGPPAGARSDLGAARGLEALRGGGRTLFFVSVAVDGDSSKAGARGSAWPTPRPTARSAPAG